MTPPSKRARGLGEAVGNKGKRSKRNENPPVEATILFPETVSPGIASSTTVTPDVGSVQSPSVDTDAATNETPTAEANAVFGSTNPTDTTLVAQQTERGRGHPIPAAEAGHDHTVYTSANETPLPAEGPVDDRPPNAANPTSVAAAATNTASVVQNAGVPAAPYAVPAVPAAPNAVLSTHNPAPIPVNPVPAVGSAAANPVYEDIDMNARPWLEGSVTRRLNSMCYYHDEETATYGIYALPAPLAWGTSRAPHNPTHNLLCHKANPVRIWGIGDASILFFNDNNGNVKPLGGLAVTPFVERHFNILHDLKHTFANELESTGDTDDNDGQIWASRFMSKDRNNQFQPFTEIFDATKRLTVKNNMERLDASDLRKCDVVVVEFRVQRFQPSADGGDARKSRYSNTWKNWSVRFTLDAVYRILPVTPSMMTEHEPENEHLSL
ncbi:hypothetical protein EUX98_g7644 [Antrodiella citrinella]|uniref:Uncharacterized protein n=1 Tax=Antrodiella citrinella TaxID=2447956 RepID=A0A4S4MMQ1_9APHY|nr:hypothetical protein EUX98_g7644 [Antrodiella citrinella]